ncbi:MAG: heavy metal-associated domain-containing protein [Bacilli bacterium]|nr:heavy metal-associated domain-containing protein [Bacilli bacterium]
MFGSKKQTLIIKGMMCKHCAAHVEEALLKLTGVKSAKVDLDKKSATVKVDQEISKETYDKAISDAGYKLVEVA